MKALLPLILASSPAFAGDDAGGQPITEFLMSTVIETADYGVLPGFGGVVLLPQFTDQQKLDFLDQDEPLPPAPVPLPGSLAGMAGALIALFIAAWVLG